MKVVIAGATGFIGKALCEEICKNYEVIALTRDTDKASHVLNEKIKVVQWDAATPNGWQEYVNEAFAIINLAGENIGSGHWHKGKKEEILQTRINSAKAIIEAIKSAAIKPKVVIQASAIGYYGSRGDEQLNETSEQGAGFLADLCGQLEKTISGIEGSGTRLIIIRSGIVLGQNGGILEKLVKAFESHMGGYFGKGAQWASWISMYDEIAAIQFLMENETLKGAFNLTVPEPVKMKEFCEILGNLLEKPVRAVPEFVAKLIFGEMADEVFLASQRVLPKRLLDAGFKFKYKDVKTALKDIIGHS
jgi:uncharacterized protein